ncbi:MAG: hypothetical protein ACOYKE_02465 [Ferruginibacter sp.]
MARKKVSGIGAIDRQIKSTRTKISAIKKKASAEKTAKRKKAQLAKLQNQLRRMSGTRKRK